MKNTQRPEAFVFTAGGHRYTCLSNALLDRFYNLGVDISIANETVDGWGYAAAGIKEELDILGIDSKEYRYRDEAYLDTEQLQSLVTFYLSFANPEITSRAPRFI